MSWWVNNWSCAKKSSSIYCHVMPMIMMLCLRLALSDRTRTHLARPAVQRKSCPHTSVLTFISRYVVTHSETSCCGLCLWSMVVEKNISVIAMTSIANTNLTMTHITRAMRSQLQLQYPRDRPIEDDTIQQVQVWRNAEAQKGWYRTGRHDIDHGLNDHPVCACLGLCT